jgi:hypothetical protein
MSQTGLSHMQDAPIREAGDVDNSKFKGMACVFILFSSYQNFIFQFVGNIILYVSLFLVSTYVFLPQKICFNDKQTIVSHLLRKGF